MSYRDEFWGWYPPSKPKKVEGGIKVKSKRGTIGDTWWSKRWVKVLESFGWTNRLERGRRYARSGQVLDFVLSPGKVTARVQGSMAEPYSVIIEIEPLIDKEWNDVLEEMSGKAIFAAKLLAGEMPQNIEEAFDAASISLFPESSKDIKTDCTCPDSANPCKHIAAVYYILAEEFDRDPFMLFKLRGKTKDDITVSLRKMRTAGNDIVSQSEVHPSGEVLEKKELPLSVDNFWAGEGLESFSVNISPPDVSAAIIKSLGTPEFWDSKEDFNRTMSRFYEDISRHAVDAAYGEKIGRKKTEKRKID